MTPAFWAVPACFIHDEKSRVAIERHEEVNLRHFVQFGDGEFRKQNPWPNKAKEG